MKLPHWVRFWKSPRSARSSLLLQINVLLALCAIPTLAFLLQPALSNLASTRKQKHPEVSRTVEASPASPGEADRAASSQNASSQNTVSQSSCSPGANLVATDATSPRVHPLNLSALVASLGTTLSAQLATRPFPQISDQARLARVPVIMFHDILPVKEVFFDVTPAEFEADLQLIQKNGLTPISLDQLVEHLRTGAPLPEKPIVLSFDDGYLGHYKYVYPLLKKYHYPAVFGIYTAKVGANLGRPGMTWAQLREMAADPLVTIASHSVTHPSNLAELPDDRLRQEVVESKRILETQLGIPINHFIYPEGKFDERVEHWAQLAGYHSALTMKDEVNKFAGESKDLLTIERIGQSQLSTVISEAYGGPPLPTLGKRFNFSGSVRLTRRKVDNVPLILASGGRPTTIHAKSRYQVSEIVAKTNAVAAVDGGFFSLELLNSNYMIGPVFSQSTGKFVPTGEAENRGIVGRPLVLIGPDAVEFIPYDPKRHNSLKGIQAEMPAVTDAFVAAAWLVKDGQPQPTESFGKLYGFDAPRDRAFWGIDQAGEAVVGVSADYVDSVSLGKALSQAGLRDVVMLDSGASASLTYQGKSMMSYEPRPVPHVVALLPPQEVISASTPCGVVSQNRPQE